MPFQQEQVVVLEARLRPFLVGVTEMWLFIVDTVQFKGYQGASTTSLYEVWYHQFFPTIAFEVGKH